MGVIRKDYLLDKFVYYAVKRGERPKEFKKTAQVVPSSTDFFAPGNEHLTPPQKGQVPEKGEWQLRWFDNKFAALELSGSPKPKGKYKESSNYGVHEVIVETREQMAQLSDMPLSHFVNLLKVYRSRIAELSKIKGIEYVVIFKNHGSEAGTSLIHEHSQVMALPQVPPTVMQEMCASAKSKISPYLKIAKDEMKTQRGISQNKHFIAFCPFASQYNYEAWIFPKTDIRTLGQCDDAALESLASLLKGILTALKSVDASYNFYLHYAPKGSNLPLHIEITPRLAHYGGFELGSGCIINSVLPEDAAAFYKERMKG